MASIIDTIKQAITNTGATALRTVSSINPQVGGSLGKAVDTVGKALGNPFPEAYASEQAQSTGGQATRQAIESNTSLNQAQKDAQLKALEAKATATAGFSSANSSQPKLNLTPRDPATMTQAERQTLWEQAGHSGTAPVGYGGESGGSGNGGGEPPLSGEDVANAIRNSGGLDLLGENDLKALMDKYSGQSRGNAQALADEIERTARENGKREYDTIMQALGVQKGEVQTTASEQKANIEKEKQLGLTELTDKQDTETKSIEKQKGAYQQEVASTADTLARNWRDMSMQVQRIMRARGVSDSSFSGKAETDVLLDFNKGLRTLAKQSTDAVQNFADAVVETEKFYTREKNKLEVSADEENGKIDTWVRQQVQNIQAQENMALTDQLNQIKDAISKGNQLKIQTEQSIADKQNALDTWVVQTQVNYKNAVALAGQNKTADAQKLISDYRQEAIRNNDLLLKGGYQLDTTTVNGKSVPVLHGYLPNGQVDEIYLTDQGAQSLQTNLQNYQTGKMTSTDQIIANAQNNTSGANSSGLLGTLSNILLGK